MIRKRYAITAILTFAILLFIACNPDKNKGNIVAVRLTSEPTKLNPIVTEDANALIISSQIFMSLLDFDPNTLDITPSLAKSRPQIVPIDTGKFKGGVAYVYEIKDEAIWENGQPVTAADYVFTVKTILNKKIGSDNLRSTVEFIKDIVVDTQNPKKLTIYSPKPYILSENNSGTFFIMPEYVYDSAQIMRKFSIADLVSFGNDTIKWKNPDLLNFASAFQNPKFSNNKSYIIGCGPYSLDNWVVGQSLTLKKKSNWWGDKLVNKEPILAAYPDQIVYKPIKDNAATMSLVQNEELDAVVNIPVKDFNNMKQDPKLSAKYNMAAVSLPSLAMLGFNCKSPLLNDKKTRRAIAHTVDVQTIIKNIAGGYGVVCPSPFVIQRPYFDKTLLPLALDIEKATALLAEAGWKDSDGNGIVDKKIGGKTTDLTLRFVFAASESSKNLGLLLQDNAKKAGINIILVPYEGNTVFPVLKKRDFDIFLNSPTFPPGLDDPKEIWASTANTPEGGNRFQFENKQADTLIEQIRGELNEAKRNELYKQFQALLYDEQPAVFMFIRQERLALHKRFNAPVIARRPGFSPNMFQLK
jgi:peptide/nickel transport system substrate-binding protein